MINNLEGILIGELDVNDGIRYSVESFVFKPAEAKPQWADNADSDGAVLVQEPHYTNAYFELQIRVEPARDQDEALEAVGDLLDAIHSAKRTPGGLPIPWTPNASTRTYTWYALLGELEELPTELNGDLAGWFIDSPVVKVKMTCRPFGYGDERVVLEPLTSSEPLQVLYLENIEGDVPAEATLRVTDEAMENRRYFEWGQDVVAAAADNSPLEMEIGVGLTITGFMGELATRGGSRSEKAAEVVLTQTPVVICSTGQITHTGTFKLKGRVLCAGAGGLFRASYRVGEGPWTSLPWVTPQVIGSGFAISPEAEWADLDLGEAFLEEVSAGPQVSEIRIEGRAEQGAPKLSAFWDLLDLFPSRRWGRAHAPLTVSLPTSILWGDAFDQSAGTATGGKAEYGGALIAPTNSDTTDFTFAGGKLKRTAIGDTGSIGSAPLEGRGIGVATKVEDLGFRFDYNIVGSALNEGFGAAAFTFGQIVSYVDNTHFIAVTLEYTFALGWTLIVRRPDGTPIGTVGLGWHLGPAGIEPTNANYRTGTLMSIVHGNVLSVYLAGEAQTLTQLVSIEDPLVGVEARCFIYDQWTGGGALTREYDNVALWVPDQQLVCASGRALEVRGDSEDREDQAGDFWSPMPYRGSHFLLDPAGREERVNRLALRMRRNDVVGEPSRDLTDPQSVEVRVRERVLAPR